MKEDNGGFGTNVSDMEKRLKEFREKRVEPNKNMEESKKRRLLIQSEAMYNTNNGSIGPPYNPPSPKSISVGGVGGVLCILSVHHRRGNFTNEIDDEMDDVMSLGYTSQNSGALASMQSFKQLKRAKYRLLEVK